jgi:hypothetical protein
MRGSAAGAEEDVNPLCLMVHCNRFRLRSTLIRFFRASILYFCLVGRCSIALQLSGGGKSGSRSVRLLDRRMLQCDREWTMLAVLRSGSQMERSEELRCEGGENAFIVSVASPFPADLLPV